MYKNYNSNPNNQSSSNTVQSCSNCNCGGECHGKKKKKTQNNQII